MFSHNINFHIGSQADFWKIEHVLAFTTFNLGYEYILNCLNCIQRMFQEVPLYNEFVRHVLQLFFIVILTNDVFP